MRACQLIRIVAVLSALPWLAACVSDGQHAPAGGGSTRTWSFEEDVPGAAPVGFSFSNLGGGPAGRWEVRLANDAADGRRVLVQADTDDTDLRFLVAVADAPAPADLRLTVRGRPLSGLVDQVVGVVFRYQDANNYYLVRTNVLEDNVRLYHITGGVRQQIGSWKGTVAADRWQTLSVEARGDHLRVSYEGSVVIDLHDATITGPGRVGLWTKADSLTQFDQLEVEPLGR